MTVGMTYKYTQAISAATNSTHVASGGTYEVPLAYLPATGKTVYVVVSEPVPEGDTLAAIQGGDGLTLIGSWAGGEARGTDVIDIDVAGGQVFYAVFSLIGAGDEATVSSTITFEFSGEDSQFPV